MRPDHGAPHMGYRRTVESQPFPRLLEIPSHHVLKLIDAEIRHIGIEGVEIIQGNQPRGHVPAVIARLIVLGLHPGLDLVVCTEPLSLFF